MDQCQHVVGYALVTVSQKINTTVYFFAHTIVLNECPSNRQALFHGTQDPSTLWLQPYHRLPLTFFVLTGEAWNASQDIF